MLCEAVGAVVHTTWLCPHRHSERRATTQEDRQLRDTHNVRENMCNAMSCPNEMGGYQFL